MKRKLLVISLLSLILFNHAYSQENNKSNFNIWGSGTTFKLDATTDSIILGTGAALNLAWLTFDKIIKVDDEVFNPLDLNINSINGFDRTFMNPYSKTLDTMGDITLFAAIASPLILALTPSEEWLTIGTMYAESLMFANGIKELLKLSVHRPRPYMYYENYPAEKVLDGDWNDSFPSGHTSFAFASATFCSYVYAKYFPDGWGKWVVSASAYSLAIATATFRMLSGNHFATDVLTGALIGSLSGFLIPWLHTVNISSGTQISATPARFQLAIKL